MILMLCLVVLFGCFCSCFLRLSCAGFDLYVWFGGFGLVGFLGVCVACFVRMLCLASVFVCCVQAPFPCALFGSFVCSFS